MNENSKPTTRPGTSEQEDYRRALAQFDPAEKDRRKKSAAQGVPTAEVLQRLRQLSKQI